MKLRAILRVCATLLVIFCLFNAPLMAVTPAAVAFKKGEKNFRQGLKHEVAEQWDKAAEEFALAVAANPGNSEYRLHYRRALFNASQMLFMRGRVFAEQKNYTAAYNAFRQAYGYDPTNELAKAEMERMVRLQKEAEDPNDPNKPDALPGANPAGVKLVPTAYNPAAAVQDPPQIEQLRNVIFTRVPLKEAIQNLARDLDLNVLFDAESFGANRGGPNRELTIELKDVTTAQALDAVFLQEGLFFQRVGKRMIIVANGATQRQKFQQLVLRTFYLSNAKPQEVQKVLQSAIPAQPGRPPTVPIIDEATNSITVRDTAENIKIIGNLIKALDKDRAEVVMDVNIYEVSKSDLLQLGAQIGDDQSLVNLGGTSSGLVEVGRIRNNVYGSTLTETGKVVNNLSRSIGAGILLPQVQIKALQGKGNTKLLASTQVHAFNNEESQARIGQRVPVRTAQLLGYNNQPGQPNTGNGFNNAADVINYEQVGLTLKFTPIVFPNQDVQVKMSIESKDVVTTGLTPTFSERTISGTARIQNNRTLLLASVAQDTQTNSKVGLPLLGLIPIFGRLFTAPEKLNRQVDIVIAVTPRVLRAPAILPEDEIERPTGSIAVPTNSSLADMMRQEDTEDRLAAARRLPNTAVVQLPDQKSEEAAPGYVPANGQQSTVNTAAVSAPTNTLAPDVTPKQIDSSIKTLNIAPTSEKLNEQPQTEQPPLVNNQSEAINAELKVEPLGALKAGEKRRVAVMVKSPLALRLAVVSLGFDPAKIKINRVLYGEVFGIQMANKEMTSFAASNGNLMATFPTAPNSNAQGVGVLAYIEVEALADSENAAFQINNTVSSLIGYSGETLTLNR